MDGDQKTEVKIVPYIVFESEQARNERDKRRTIIICTILLTAAIAACGALGYLLYQSNKNWLDYISQFDIYDYTQDGDGLNNINTGEQGDVRYGSEITN